jgi:hypothetical protein
MNKKKESEDKIEEKKQNKKNWLMKRKAEPTGGTAAEDEGSRVLRVVGQEQEEEEEEHASNFLSALPDLALGAVLDFLQQQQQQEATTPCKDDDSKRSGSLPELWHLLTRHRAFVAHSQFLHRYDEQSIEPSLEEWTAYKNELAARPKPPAHISFVPLFVLSLHSFFFLFVDHSLSAACAACASCARQCNLSFEKLMESDAPGRWASPSLLALRLTCHSVKWAVEAVARRGLFPQFELFTSVDRWLTSRVEWPTLLVASSPEEARHQHSIRELEGAAIACANARMHQLRSTFIQPLPCVTRTRTRTRTRLRWC